MLVQGCADQRSTHPVGASRRLAQDGHGIGLGKARRGASQLFRELDAGGRHRSTRTG